MRFSELPPAQALPEDLTIPERSDTRFAGFDIEAFNVLAHLRASPEIGTYRLLKDDLRRFVQEPFKVYRDDLVVLYVLPNRLPLETERNVFSRFLKNDFGAGGSHSHLWLSFYRVGRSRLTDVQLASSISPDGLTIGLHSVQRMGSVHRHFVKRVQESSESLTGLLEDLEPAGFSASVGGVPGAERGSRDAIGRLRVQDRFSVRRSLPADAVVEMQGELVAWSVLQIEMLWPLYRYMIGV